MLQGVAALHERSIIHFDLKPANVFLRGEVARVGDYGLSKLVTQSARTLSMGRGTPAYMAPEMLQRKGDARSDVYSLGAMLFEVLSGRAPFQGDSEWEVLKKHESAAVVFPDTIPLAVRPLILRALDKDPERRFRDAGAMLEAFDALTVRGAGAGAPRPLRGFHRHRRRSRQPPGGATSAARSDAASPSFPRRCAASETASTSCSNTWPSEAKAAKAEYDRARRTKAPTPGYPAPPRRRGFVRRVLRAPFRVVRWVFSNLLTVVATLLIAGALIGLVEVVLQQAIG